MGKGKIIHLLMKPSIRILIADTFDIKGFYKYGQESTNNQSIAVSRGTLEPKPV